MSSVQDLSRGPKDETVAEAIVRYETFIATVVRPDENDDDWREFYKVKRGTPFTKEEFSKIEEYSRTKGYRIPEEIKSFYINHGAFEIGEPSYNDGLRILPLIGDPVKQFQLYFYSLSVADFVMYHVKRQLTAEEFTHIEQNYVLFGGYFQNDNNHEYFFFDKDGNGCNSLSWDQDYSGREEAEFLLQPPVEACRFSFRDTVVDAIDARIEYLCERWEL